MIWIFVAIGAAVLVFVLGIATLRSKTFQRWLLSGERMPTDRPGNPPGEKPR